MLHQTVTVDVDFRFFAYIKIFEITKFVLCIGNVVQVLAKLNIVSQGATQKLLYKVA